MSVYPVVGECDIGHVRREIEQTATSIGFGAEEIAELAFVATELASNLVRHRTVDGRIEVSRVIDDPIEGIEIRSTDLGPGIADLRLALRDHHSTNGTYGCGLGAVQRLMDEFDISSGVAGAKMGPGETARPASGTVVVTRKWMQKSPRTARFAYSAHSRPFPGEQKNGDSFVIYEDRKGLCVGVIDGLGHGPNAALASQAAASHIHNNKSKDLPALMLGLHEALHGTRGAAVTLMRICLPERRLLHIGIGNVAAQLHPRGNSNLVSRPGVIGVGAPPKIRVNEMPWPPDGLLVVYSDGLTSRWDLAESPQLMEQEVVVIGHHLIRNHARATDDATVVVVRGDL